MKNRFDLALSWDDLPVFLAIEAAGSLLGAAGRLGISVATVSRRLDRLEESLGLRLFHRTASGLTLTREAEPLVGRAEAVLGGVLDLVRTAEGCVDGSRGTVTVNTPDTVVERLLVPGLAGLRAAHPGIRLVIRSSPRLTKLSHRTADVAVRVVRPAEQRVVRRRVATLRYALFASPAYLARRGRPASPETDLRGHDLVTYDARMDALPEVDWLRARATDDDLTLRFNTLAGIVAAVESGAGLGVLPDFLAGDHLVCLCAGEALPRREVWLAVHEDVHRLPRVRTVVDFLAAQLAAA